MLGVAAWHSSLVPARKTNGSALIAPSSPTPTLSQRVLLLDLEEDEEDEGEEGEQEGEEEDGDGMDGSRYHTPAPSP